MPFILFGTAVGLSLYAVGQLLARPLTSLRVCLAVGFFSLSYILIYYWAMEIGVLQRMPLLVNSDLSASFFAPPAMYVSFVIILREGRDPPRHIRRFFYFPVLFTIGAALYNGVTMPDYIQGVIPGNLSTTLLTLISLASDVYVFAYFALAFLHGLRLWAAGRVHYPREYRFIMCIIATLMAVSLFMLSGYIVRQTIIFPIASVLFGLVALTYSVACSRLYEYSQRQLSPVSERKRALIAQWDAEAELFDARLSRLMGGETLYTDASLSLKKLAARLGVPQARISYHLNAKHGRNFRSYINGLRLQQTRRNLLAHPDQSILDIALAAGFNSKTTFNATFAREFSLTPREFRKKNE